ncbi:hypothetical protein Q7P35_000963 [Cladosporium inversicolor]
MAGQSGRQQFNNTIINENARVHMGNIHHHYTNSTDVEAAEPSFRKALFITDPSVDRHSLIDKKGLRVAGTCEWVERNETYKAWLCGEPSLLWIFGGPGKGKTMLSLYLTQRFEKLHNGEVIYFFCSSEHPTRNTATAILRTLLWQMIVIRPEVTKLISPYFDLSERVIQSSEFERMQCLIDGLDECDDESSRWLAAQFTGLSSQPNNSSLHIVIASRHTSSAKHVKKIRLDPDNDQNVSDDIEKFASLKMKELSERLNLTTALCSLVRSQLVAKAGGTFLWIGYAMIELSNKRTGLEIEEAVKELPTALPALYGRMLRRIPASKLDLIVTLLHWVTLAVRPLSIDDLEDAVTWRVPERMDRRQALRDYITLCEPMVVVQDDLVLLVHQSAREYFLRDARDDDAVAERVRSTFSNAQASLAEACLVALEKSSSLSPFFGKGSASRHDWWQRRRHHWAHEDALVAEPPRLHTACYLGLEAWAHRALIELEADSILRSRVRTMRSDQLSTQYRRHCVNFRSERGWTPLHFAVRAKHSYDISYFLLRHGADPNLLDKTMRTPLANATDANAHLDTFRREDIAVSIIASGADIQAADRVRGSQRILTVLQLAASNGLEAVARVLLDHGADLQAAQGESPIPLCLAISKDRKAIVDLLLDRSANRMIFHESCASWPLRTALACRNIEMAQRIVRFGLTASEVPTEILNLWIAVLDSNDANVTSALKQGVSPNASTPSSPGCPSGLTSLHWAVVEWQHRGYSTFTLEQYGAIVRRLLEYGADASLQDSEGKTALKRAENKGRVWAAMASLISKPRTRMGTSLVGCNLELLRTGGRRP